MRRKVLAFWLVLGMALLSGGPAVPAPHLVDLPSTPLASPNVSFLANVPTGVGVGGHFMGRYFFQTTARSGVFLPGGAGGGGVYAFDATAPETPRLVGYLPLPHWQNEDVDLSAERKILLVSAERESSSRCDTAVLAAGGDRSQCVLVPPTLFVVDISDPASMRVRSQIAMPAYAGKDSKGVGLRGPGHVAECVLGCRYAYVTSSRANQGVYVIDLRDLDAPKIAGQVWNSPAAAKSKAFPEKGSIHDVDVDPLGNVWMTGSGGTALYAPLTEATVTRPKLLAYGKAFDDRYNSLIHHSSLRLNSSMVMVNEESYAGQCNFNRNPVDEALRDDVQQGSFQVWRIDRNKLKPVSAWKTEAAGYDEGAGVAILACSSHWFTINRHKVAAIGWYDQGARFVDISNPARPRQVGYWMASNASASAAYFVPWRPDIVYVADYNRGLDVVRLNRGGRGAPTTVAPMRAEWFASYQGVRFTPPLEPDPEWGAACLRPAWF